MFSCTTLNIYLLIATVSAEFYSSLVLLKTIIGAERVIPVMINGYMEKELERLNYLRKFAQEIQGRNDNVIRDDEEMIRHPIEAFLSIKGTIADWTKVVRIMQSNSADEIIRCVTNQRANKCINYPTEEDLSGAAFGLLRLQDTYRMHTKDIADGKILSSQIRTVSLTEKMLKRGNISISEFRVVAGDCFEIGRVAYNAHDYYHTILWMQEAREHVEKEAVPTANLENILEYLSFSLYKQGNLKRALLLTEELHRMNPDHPRAKNNIRGYEDLLENDGVERIVMRRDIPPVNNVKNENDLDEGAKLKYEALCRKEVPVDTKAQSRLYCYYKMDRPYLRLAPFKVEIARQNSLAVLFYDIMSDEEARIIQMLAVPKACLVLIALCYSIWMLIRRFKRAIIRNFLAENPKSVYYVYKSASLKPTEHELIKRIDRRLELATNLEIKTAEDLVVHNYGIGGHFEPHLDCEWISVISAAV
ncbi:unnamed protein product [Onchocerca ochengi]|uniref:P4Ha_N domain-containing protein n=1 Tax=Onchocerca ochengi TaxID=42157 RepID=A0A182EQ14_ONCOC|nr:unnamed protein product [Onchocerca ochengi]